MSSENFEEQILHDKLKHLKKLETIGLLAGGIAHDFNNVLAGIIGFTELSLRKLEKDHPVSEYLKTILKKSENAAELVRKLMYFSKDSIQNLKTLDLNSLIKSTISFINKYIGEDIEFCLQLDPKLRNIHADYSALEQIITNLVINARDAMPDGGIITINTRNVHSTELPVYENTNPEWNEFIKLSIIDTGVGMDQEVKDKIFDPFFTTKEMERGTGLGLTTVKEIIKEHHGVINCDSVIGEGTNFEIFLPACLEKVQTAKSKKLKNIPGGNETILIVEDDEDLLYGFKISLENYGYTVFSAVNGKEALDVFSQNKNQIKLIVADIVLPEIGGIDLYLLLKKEHPSLGFLLISGYQGDAMQGIRGINTENYLQKPFHITELAYKIRKMLDLTQ